VPTTHGLVKVLVGKRKAWVIGMFRTAQFDCKEGRKVTKSQQQKNYMSLRISFGNFRFS